MTRLRAFFSWPLWDLAWQYTAVGLVFAFALDAITRVWTH